MKSFAIIEKLGGRRASADVIEASGRACTPDTVRMWCQRQRIPGYAIPVLMSEAEARGLKVSSADFEPITVTRRARMMEAA